MSTKAVLIFNSLLCYQVWENKKALNCCVLLYSIRALNRPFARWRHFTTTTRVLQGFAFVGKLGFCYLNLTGITKFKLKKETKRILVLVVRGSHRANGPLVLLVYH